MEQIMAPWYTLETSQQQFVFFAAALAQVILLVFAARKRAPLGWVFLYILEAVTLVVAVAGSNHYDAGFWSMGSGFTHLFAMCGFAANAVITIAAHLISLLLGKKEKL